MPAAGGLGAMQERSLLEKGALGKPDVLSGKESDWPSWHFVFQIWIARLTPKMRSRNERSW